MDYNHSAAEAEAAAEAAVAHEGGQGMEEEMSPLKTTTTSAAAGGGGGATVTAGNNKMMSPLYHDVEETKEEVLPPGAVPYHYNNEKNNHNIYNDNDDEIKKKIAKEGNTKRPPSSSSGGLKSDPPPEESMKDTNQHRDNKNQRGPRGQKNPLFQELETTGAWGTISNLEKIMAVVILLVVLGGVIGAVLVFVVFRKDTASDSNLPPRPPPPTMAPSQFPENDPALQLAAILQAIQNNSVVSETLATATTSTSSITVVLPNDVSYYTMDKVLDPSEVAAVRAMSWILTEDPRDEAPDSVWLLPRFALATLYYSTTGINWNNHTFWLSQEHACDWYGVYCDRFRASMTELNLNSNNLKGSLPAALGLLSTLQGLVLTTNRLTGTPPFGALGSLPRLSFLFLDNNQLTGTINPDVRANGVLTTLMVQRNAFTGTWPSEFCNGQNALVQKYAVDCGEVDISGCSCCGVEDDLAYSCF